MGKGRILVVEDDIDISKMLRIYFDSQGYEVLVANRGNDALDTCRTRLPNVVVLDIQLPGIDGYEVCRTLRNNTRTSYVPIIFLTQKDERSDKIFGLKLGADDYITKPFDIEEFKLRVEGAIRRSQRKALTHPVTNLPAGKLIEEQLKEVKESAEPWILLYFGVRNVNAFKEIAGPIQVNEILIFLADVMRETVEKNGTMNDFIGQASDSDFIIITIPEVAGVICKTITERFDEESGIFYPLSVREAGKISYQDIDGITREAGLMKLVVGVVSSNDGPFADIVQITEDAAENRRRNLGCPGRHEERYGGWPRKQERLKSHPLRDTSRDRRQPQPRTIETPVVKRTVRPRKLTPPLKTKGRILIVDDNVAITKKFRIYFSSLGYEVLVNNRGNDAIDTCRKRLPNVIISNIQLPDIDGYGMCRILKNNTRTSHVPIIFLTEIDEPGYKNAALEVGADDYITEPFDDEELKVRVEGAIRRSLREGLIHSVTNLPADKLVEEQLSIIQTSTEPWTLLYFGIRYITAFKEAVDSTEVDKALIFLADIIRETVETCGTPNDFIGQISDNEFVVITTLAPASIICKTVTQQFNEGVGVFYPSSIREVGKVTYQDIDGVTQAVNLMKLAVGVVSSSDGPFTNSVQIIEDAAENWRQNFGCPEEIASPEDIDYSNQLAEQVSLWEAMPELAEALIKINRLTSGKIHDISKIGVLLDIAPNKELTELPTETFTALQKHQQLCRLAYENLNELRYKIHSYQEFKPASLGQTLENTLDLLQAPQISHNAIIPGPEVNIPELKLQQAIYNVCRWLLFDHGEGDLNISTEVTKEVASLIFTSARVRGNQLEISTLPKLLNQNDPGSVYGYLAQKIMVRYGGNVKLSKKQIIMNLPLGEHNKPNVSNDELQKKIEEQRIFLDALENLSSPLYISEIATELIDVVAEDLLVRIEAMLEDINTSPGLDNKAPPWSAIERNLRFFRLLTLDLWKKQPFIPAPVNLKSLLESIKPLLAHKILEHNIIVESEVTRPVLNTDRMRLLQIFVNLALNALEAMPEDGILKFRIKQDGKLYIVEVIDDGSGIAPENLPNVFDLYFTTKGSGRGIGLHSVKTYVKELNGKIEVSSEIGKGTTFTVKLPPNWEAGYF